MWRGLSFIKPDQKCGSTQRGQDYLSDEFCASADNGLYPIGGQIATSSNAVLEIDSSLPFDSVGAWSDDITSGLVLSSSRRGEVKLFQLKPSIMSLVHYRTVNIDHTTPIDNKNGLLFDYSSSPPTLLLSARNSVNRVRLSNCDTLSTCFQCLSHVDPYCGWCPSSGQCSSRSLCPEPAKWLKANESTAVDSLCVDVDSIEPHLVHKTNGEWLQVNFRKTIPAANSTYACVFVASGDTRLSTDAVQISPTRLKCPAPHPSQVDKFLAEAVDAILLPAEDGIFKVNPNYNPFFENLFFYRDFSIKT